MRVTFSWTRKRILRVSDARFAPWDDFCTVWHIFDLLPGDPSPTIGQRNTEIYGGSFGLPAAEIAELRHSGVI